MKSCVLVSMCVVCERKRGGETMEQGLHVRVFVFLLPQMLLNLHKKSWMDGLQLTDYKEHSANNEKTIKVSSHNMLSQQ